jgi:uncharacterized protein
MAEAGSAQEVEPEPHWTDDPGNSVKAIALQGLICLAAALAIWWGQGHPVSKFVTLRLADLVIGGATAAAMIGAMQSLLLLFPHFKAWASDQQRFLFAGGRAYSATQIILISLAAGVGEEALFRGGLQTWFVDYLTPWTAILVVSIVFAAIHIGRWTLRAFVFAYSIGFGLLYLLTNSLLGCMIAHFLFDIWAISVVQRELKRQGVIH